MQPRLLWGAAYPTGAPARCAAARLRHGHRRAPARADSSPGKPLGGRRCGFGRAFAGQQGKRARGSPPPKKAPPVLVNQLLVKEIPKQLTLVKKSSSAEVAGTPTGLEGLGGALLKLALLLLVLAVVATAVITLLVRLVVRWVRKARQRKR